MDWREAERAYDGVGVGDTTIPELFEATVERCGHRPAQQYKGGVYDRSLTETLLPAAPDGEYRTLTYADVGDIVRHLAAGFRDIGVEGGTRVAIYAHTRMEWAQTDFAVLAAGGVVTTVYPSSSPDRVRYLLDDPDADGVVLEGEEQFERLLAVEDDLSLEFVVLLDSPTGETAEVYERRDDVYTLADVHDRGAELYRPEDYESWLAERDPGDLCSLIYTSGTTGQPKGVRLTHRNFRSNVNQVLARFGPREDREGIPAISEDSRTVSFLPLAHVFERLAGHYVMAAAGACVAYAESPDTLQEDFSLVEPTTATSVPRVYEKIYDAIREQATESDLKRRIFEWAVEVGREYHETDSPGVALRAKRAVADRLVYSKVTDALGGNVDFLISGGGSLSPELCTLFHGMGLPILEGYGLTETSPVVAVNPPEAPKVGTIGLPVVDQEVRIDDSIVAEGQFDDEGEVGELLVRGPNVTDGYWNRPEATEAAFEPADDDGDPWFRTGDVVHYRPDDYIEFRERAKQLLVLSTGKNVAPGPIEDAFAASDVVEQCMVLGDERKFVAALIVPNLDGIRAWAEAADVDLPDDPEAICEHEAVRDRIQREVDRANEGFDPHETIKQFELVPEEFTEENDLLTPTMKKKRRTILSRYDELVEAIYEDA